MSVSASWYEDAIKSARLPRQSSPLLRLPPCDLALLPGKRWKRAAISAIVVAADEALRELDDEPPRQALTSFRARWKFADRDPAKAPTAAHIRAAIAPATLLARDLWDLAQPVHSRDATPSEANFGAEARRQRALKIASLAWRGANSSHYLLYLDAAEIYGWGAWSWRESEDPRDVRWRVTPSPERVFDAQARIAWGFGWVVAKELATYYAQDLPEMNAFLASPEGLTPAIDRLDELGCDERISRYLAAIRELRDTTPLAA